MEVVIDVRSVVGAAVKASEAPGGGSRPKLIRAGSKLCLSSALVITSTASEIRACAASRLPIQVLAEDDEIDSTISLVSL